jgi:hypothetical protein
MQSSEVSGSAIDLHSVLSKPARVVDVVAAAMVEDVVEGVVGTTWVVCGLVWDASEGCGPVDAAACVVLSLDFSVAHPHKRITAIKDKTNRFMLNKME